MPQHHPDITSIIDNLKSTTTVDAHITILTFFNTAKNHKKIDKDAYAVIESTLNNDEKIRKQLERLNDTLKKDKTSRQVLYITGKIYYQIMDVVLHQKVKNELAQYRPSTPPPTAPKIARLR